VRYFSKTPSQPLGDFVERLWHFRDAPAHSRERIVPSGTVELVINLQEDEVRIYDPARPDCCKRFSGAVVSGVYSGCFVIDTREHASIIGVHFRAGGAFPFFDIPVSELRDTHVDLEALWGAAAAELRERLCAAVTPAERFCLLEKTLMDHLSRSLERHSAVRFALNAFARADSDLIVGDIAEETGFSQRRFIQVFKQEVGMSPKLFCRVRRFQQALALAQRQTAPNWAHLALECGYFDQSHFINEFRSFSGLSPLEYARQRSERVLQNHVPVIV
jgi:AraC-like DNA-binding protein